MIYLVNFRWPNFGDLKFQFRKRLAKAFEQLFLEIFVGTVKNAMNFFDGVKFGDYFVVRFLWDLDYIVMD